MEVLVQAQVEQAISKEAKRLRELVEELGPATTNAANLDADYKVASAQARITARVNGASSDKRAEDIAMVQTEEQRRACLLAEANVSTLREALRASQARMSAFQSLLSSIVRVT